MRVTPVEPEEFETEFHGGKRTFASGKAFGKSGSYCLAVLLCMVMASCAFYDTGRFDRHPDASTQPPMGVSTATGDEDVRPPMPQAISSSQDPIRVTVENAVFLALENNRSLQVERLNPAIRQTFEDQERAAFDPSLSIGGEFSRQKEQQTARGSSGVLDVTSDETTIDVGVSQSFATGTDVSVDLSTEITSSNSDSNQYESRIGLSVTQALLRGFGADVNLASLRQANLDTRSSRYELHGFAEALVAQVEKTYWDYALAQREIEIVEESLALAKQQLVETEEMIKVGKLAEIEVTAAQAEIAARRQSLINARSAMATTRLRLLRLLNPPGSELWGREITLLSRPVMPEEELEDVSAHAELALRMRPDLNQARLDVQRDELEIVKTKNGLLPKKDLFVTLGKTGYADSFGGTTSNIDDDYYDFAAGIKFNYPLKNRESEAIHRRSLLRHDQTAKALENLAQLVELDVRSAHIEVNRAKEQISASKATRELQEEKLRIETEKFRVGRSTNFLVSQAQRDLLLSQIAEVRAFANYLQALVDFYRLEGTLLSRRGLVISD